MNEKILPSTNPGEVLMEEFLEPVWIRYTCPAYKRNRVWYAGSLENEVKVF
jgi:hypothetical protein